MCEGFIACVGWRRSVKVYERIQQKKKTMLAWQGVRDKMKIRKRKIDGAKEFAS